MGMVQCQQELPTTSVNIQELHFRVKMPQNRLPIIPGQIIFFRVPPMDMGEIPAMNVGDVFLRFPAFDPFTCVHK